MKNNNETMNQALLEVDKVVQDKALKQFLTKLIKKEIPVKPRLDHFSNHYDCPNCCGRLIQERYYPYRCDHCGQKLDWFAK